MAERHQRIDGGAIDAFLETLEVVPVQTAEPSLATVRNLAMPAARDHLLTIYDAAYLELAGRRAVPLATLDRLLMAAAPQGSRSGRLLACKRHHPGAPRSPLITRLVCAPG